MKTYESIEVGNTLNALSDLTGDICEFYAQDINPPANLFYIMYKSYLNRSLVVCWRNQKRLTHTGFHHTLESIEVNMIHVVEVGFFFWLFCCCIFLSKIYIKWKTNRMPLATGPPMPRLLFKFKYWNYSMLTLVRNVEKAYHTYDLSLLGVIRKPNFLQIQIIKRGITLVSKMFTFMKSNFWHYIKLLTWNSKCSSDGKKR
jgi:hypothetical protein